MAEETDKTTEAKGEASKGGADKKAKDTKDQAKSGGLLPRVLMGVGVIIISGAAGAGASLLLNSSGKDVAGEGPAAIDIQEQEPPKEFEYYAFEPVTVNLNVRRGNRYLKVVMFLAIAQDDKDEAIPEIQKRTKELKNWVMGYLRDHTLEEVTGKKNQVRIQREIAQSFNERLWPDGRPRVDHVLFDEFTVQ
ncbi:MAG: flagellar basal body-associated FliL family protein [Phycisphaerae bacterium]|nr:flagellar basal body-associated FliL family protein [Phycisphaerae bacterium]